MKVTSIVLLTGISLLLILQGCTSHQLIDRNASTELEYSNLNNRLANKKAQIILKNGASFIVKDISLQQNVTSWKDFPSGSTQTIETASIKEIRINRKDKGALQGLGLGASIGGTLGAGIGYAAGSSCRQDDSCGFWDTPKENRALVSGYYIGAIGGTIGLIGGLIRGSTEVYTLGPENAVRMPGHKESVATSEQKAKSRAHSSSN